MGQFLDFSKSGGTPGGLPLKPTANVNAGATPQPRSAAPPINPMSNPLANRGLCDDPMKAQQAEEASRGLCGGQGGF